MHAGSGGRVDSQAPLIHAAHLGVQNLSPFFKLLLVDFAVAVAHAARGMSSISKVKYSTSRTTTLNQNDEAVQVQIANLIVPADSLPTSDG